MQAVKSCDPECKSCDRLCDTISKSKYTSIEEMIVVVVCGPIYLSPAFQVMLRQVAYETE